jgi:amino acid transporter
MAEETKNPSRNVPNAMTGSMILVRLDAQVERNELT